MRRMFWVAVGLGAGASVGLTVTRWARHKTERLTPASLGRQVAGVARDAGSLLREAGAEFRAGMREKEAEIRRLADGGPPERGGGEEGEGWARLGGFADWTTVPPRR